MSRPRYGWMDWLRGLMVLLMIQGHALDAWLAPDAEASRYAEFVRVYLNAMPSRLFLFLLGMAVTIRLERGDLAGSTAVKLAPIVRRGLALLAIAYLFRFQQLAMRGFSDWDLGRVDILNCLAATMLLIALLLAPLPARLRPWLALLVAAAFFALGPVLGTRNVSTALPEALTAYVGGTRPMAWFPLFPWAGWGFLGAAAGRLWMWATESPARTRRLYAAALLGGLPLAAAGLVLERVAPWQYPSEIESDMGVARTALYLGLIGITCALAGLLSNDRGALSSLLIRLGRASLVIYWVHIELIYGRTTASLHDRLSLSQAMTGLAVIVAALLVIDLGIRLSALQNGARWLASGIRRNS